jgi:hypothetical protein
MIVVRLISLFLLLFSGQVFAVINTCIDADGRKTFSDFSCKDLGLKSLNSVSPVVAPQGQDKLFNRIESAAVPVPVPVPVAAPKAVSLASKGSQINQGQSSSVQLFNIWSVPVYFGSGLDYFLYFAVFGSAFFACGYLIIFSINRFRKRTSGTA